MIEIGSQMGRVLPPWTERIPDRGGFREEFLLNSSRSRRGGVGSWTKAAGLSWLGMADCSAGRPVSTLARVNGFHPSVTLRRK